MDDERKAHSSDQLREFRERLDRAQASIRARDQESLRRGSAYSFGIRVATEMAVAIAVGFGIGWFLDTWLSTAPWMLLLFLLLGAAAGITNVLRTAKAEAARQQAELDRRAAGEGKSVELDRDDGR